MTKQMVARIERLERVRDAETDRFIVWSDPDQPGAVPELVELCGLSHEECLAVLDEPEALQ